MAFVSAATTVLQTSLRDILRENRESAFIENVRREVQRRVRERAHADEPAVAVERERHTPFGKQHSRS